MERHAWNIEHYCVFEQTSQLGITHYLWFLAPILALFC